MSRRIVDVEPKALRIPLPKPISSSLGVYTHLDTSLVTVTTDDGVTGVGFTAGLGGSATSALVPYIAAELAPLAIDQPIDDLDALWTRLWAPNKARMRGGLGVWALSAVDMALWDVKAKTEGVSLHRLLGGSGEPVPVYGSGGWHTLTDDELVQDAESFLALGITAYKFKIGTERDAHRTALLRATVGDDVTLFADANQKYTAAEAIEVSHMLADHGVAWFEEPVVADSVEELARVAAGSKVPTAVGENAYFRWGFRDICERDAAAYLQPDVGRCGGVGEFMRIAGLAEEFGLRLSSHLMHEVSISLVGASPAGYLAEYAPLIPTHILTREFAVVDGAMTIPDVPGHGVAFAEEAIARHSV